jgi:hypothetical protein
LGKVLKTKKGAVGVMPPALLKVDFKCFEIRFTIFSYLPNSQLFQWPVIWARAQPLFNEKLQVVNVHHEGSHNSTEAEPKD